MVTSSGTATVTLPTDEQILITREFDAPRHLVYKAWTTPTTLVQHTCKEHRDAHINSGMEGGMQEGMDLLEQVAVSLA